MNIQLFFWGKICICVSFPLRKGVKSIIRREERILVSSTRTTGCPYAEGPLIHIVMLEIAVAQSES